MSYNILSIPPFDKQLKRLTKKFPSLKTEFAALIETLERKPAQGKPLGNHCYKIRLAVASTGKVNPEAPGLLLTFKTLEALSFCLRFMTNQNKRI